MKKDSLLIYVGRKIDDPPLDAHEQKPVMIDRIAWVSTARKNRRTARGSLELTDGPDGNDRASQAPTKSAPQMRGAHQSTG